MGYETFCDYREEAEAEYLNVSFDSYHSIAKVKLDMDLGEKNSRICVNFKTTDKILSLEKEETDIGYLNVKKEELESIVLEIGEQVKNFINLGENCKKIKDFLENPEIEENFFCEIEQGKIKAIKEIDDLRLEFEVKLREKEENIGYTFASTHYCLN